jgi:hypothetical protein
MYDTATAISPYGNAGYALCRDPLSTDSDNNRTDLRICTASSPGSVNVMNVPPTITGLFPDNTLANNTTAQTVLINGTGFPAAGSVQFGGVTATCNFVNSTQLSCAMPSRTTVGRVTVTYTPALQSGGGAPVTAPNGFTFTGVLNGSANPQQADFCNLQFPTSFTVPRSTASPTIYGRIYEAGVTEAEGAPAGVIAQLGYGPNLTSPAANSSWRFFGATYNTQVGNDDEFQGSFTAPATPATYSYTYRFSQDNGLNFTYCDLDGAGSTPAMDANGPLGSMTVQ